MGQLLSRPHRGPYWAIHSSLYVGCRPQDIDILEEAAQYAQCGNYLKAINIYRDKCDTLDPSANLVWLLEVADTLGRSGQEQVRLEVFEGALDQARSESNDSLRDRTILQLLEMHRAESRFLNFGTMRDALEQARKLQAFLQSRSIDDYDDLCVRRLVLSIMITLTSVEADFGPG